MSNFVSLTTTKSILHHHFKVEKATGRRMTNCLWGSPGQGKTAIVNQFTKELPSDWGLVYITLSQSDPTDLKGALQFKTTNEGDYTETAPPFIYPLKGRPSSGLYPKVVIFIDEYTQASPVMMNLGANIFDGKIGEHLLDIDRTFLVAATNSRSDKSATFDMPFNTANRFHHLYVRTTIEEWTKFGIEKGINKDILSFLNLKTSFFNQLPDKEKEYGTPRSWHNVSDDLNHFGDNWQNIPYIDQLISGWVGVVGSSTFLHYIKRRKTFDSVEKVLLGNTTISTNELDIIFATAFEIALAINQIVENAYSESLFKEASFKEWDDLFVSQLGKENIFKINNAYRWLVDSNMDKAVAIMFTKYQSDIFRTKFISTMLKHPEFEQASNAYSEIQNMGL